MTDIEAIRARLAERWLVTTRNTYATHFIRTANEDISALLDEIERLAAQRDAVLALHEPYESIRECRECVGGMGNNADWPCPTARALGVTE